MSEVVEKKIAKVTGTFLGWEDHGMFTCSLTLDYGHSGQGAGFYQLSTYDPATDRQVGTAEGLEFVIRLLRACGVSSWERLVGRTVFAHATSGKVLGIEPLPTEPGEAFFFDDLWER